MANSSFACVYKITIGQKFYIGSANNFDRRIKEHLKLLRRGEHYNPKMQASFNKRQNEISAEIVLKCSIEDKFFYEQICIDGLNPYLNVAETAGAPAVKSGVENHNYGRKRSTETKAKQSASLRKAFSAPEALALKSSVTREVMSRPGMKENLSAIRIGENNPFYGKTHTEEAIAKMVHRGEKNGFYGKKHSAETLAKMSIAHTGVIRTEESRAKQSASTKGKPKSESHRANISSGQRGERNHRYGKKASEETRAKMSAAQKNRSPMSEETRSKLREARSEWWARKKELAL